MKSYHLHVKCGTIYKNLLALKRIIKSNLDDTSIYQAAMTRLGWYSQCGLSVFNFLLSPRVLAMPREKTHSIGYRLHHFSFKPKFKYTISKEYTIFLNGDNLFVNQTFLYTVYV